MEYALLSKLVMDKLSQLKNHLACKPLFPLPPHRCCIKAVMRICISKYHSYTETRTLISGTCLLYQKHVLFLRSTWRRFQILGDCR